MVPRIACTRPLATVPGSAFRGTRPQTPGSRLAEHLEHQLGEPVVQARHEDDHEEHEGQADHCVGDKLITRWPDYLAKLSHHLPEEQGRGDAVLALGRASPSAPFFRGLTACLSCHILTYWSADSGGFAGSHSQGRRDSNPQPPVLETGTLAN